MRTIRQSCGRRSPRPASASPDGDSSACSSRIRTAARSTCWTEFRTCFKGLDVLLIADTYAARETIAAGMSAEELAQGGERGRRPASSPPSTRRRRQCSTS